MSPRDVVIIAFEGAQLLDIAGPLQTFATARDLGAAPYRLTVVSRPGGAIATSSGLSLLTVPLDEAAAHPVDTLIAVGGEGTAAAMRDKALTGWIAGMAPRVRRLCSVCSGTFLLGMAGLLDDRRCTTHWRNCAELQRLFPEARVEADPIFVRDGYVWSSAGVTAGIDLALALVEEDHGRALALEVARQLVVFLKRPGGQSQYSAMLEAQANEDGAFAELHDWIAGHLHEDLRVETLAARAGMSPRNFARVYARRMGTTPAKAVERLRVEAARRALEETAAPIEAVARRCGFGDEERLRRSFLRRLGVPPKQYRQRFSREQPTVLAAAPG